MAGDTQPEAVLISRRLAAHAALVGHVRRRHFEETIDLEEELLDAHAARVGHARRRDLDTQPEAVLLSRRLSAHAALVGHVRRRDLDTQPEAVLISRRLAAHAALVGHVRCRDFKETADLEKELVDAHATRVGQARCRDFEETVDLEEELVDAHATRVGHARRRHFEETIDLDEELEADMPVKKLTVVDFRVKKKMIRDRGRYEVNPMGYLRKKLFLIPDTDDDCHLTFEVSLKNAQSVSDEEQMVAYFASALYAVNPHLGTVAMDALKTCSFDLQMCKIPSQASEAMVDPVCTYHFNAREVYGIIGVCFFLLFKDVTEDNYSGFMTKRVQALIGIGKVGMSAKRKKQMTKLFSLKHAAAIRVMLGGHLPLKQEVIRFCCANAEYDSPKGQMARYVKHILSWNEMTLYLFLYNTLCVPNSPVIYHLPIRHEVVNLRLTFSAILRSKEPQFFRYFCSDTEEELLMMNRIPVLGAVAMQLREDESNTSTVQRFKSPMSKASPLVTRLVNLHRSYVRKYTSLSNHLTNVEVIEAED